MRIRVVNSKVIAKENRFDGSFHNAEANIYDSVIRNHSEHNLSYYCSSIFTSGRNKRAYTTKQYGFPFLSNSDASSAYPFSSCKFNSMKYGYDETAVLRKGMILTGRVGAIGQTTIVPESWESKKAMGSDNIIRIDVKPEYKNGFIYAYLASRMGNLSFWKHATGGVQPFITDVMVGNLPIPSFPDDMTNKVNDLIAKSLNMRDLALGYFESAISLFESEFIVSKYQQNSKYETGVISSSCIRDKFVRFDSQYQLGKKELSKEAKGYNSIKIGRIASKIFVGNRGKRYYVKEGIPFLSSSDMMLFNPVKYSTPISSKAPNLDGLLVHTDDILISRSGTIGNTVIVSDTLNGKAVSEHALRLVIDPDKIDPNYVFCYLNTAHGKRVLESLAYGSVIITLGEEFVANIDLPLLSKEAQDTISAKIKQYSSLLDEATRLENEAVSLVEAEIEKWNN